MQKRVLVITGPTASGKSGLGVKCAKILGGEIISADSMQIYRRMDIGTAKIMSDEMAGVRHHMLDVAEPDESFSVARYVEMAAECAEDIFSRGKVPVIVGGTGLYIDSLLSGRDFAANDGDGETREKLNAEYDAIGGEAFLEKLREVDPERAAKLHAADKKRLVRAMEVFVLTGKTITEHDEETKKIPPRYESVRFALDYADRAALYERIDRRVDEMADMGLAQEVRELLAAGLSDKTTAMQAIGYKEIVSFLRGEISEQEAYDLIKQESRRYAKRQLTWLRRDKEMNWIVWDGTPDLDSAAQRIVSVFCG